MAFISTIATTILKFIVMGIIAFSGIQLGRVLRKRKMNKENK